MCVRTCVLTGEESANAGKGDTYISTEECWRALPSGLTCSLPLYNRLVDRTISRSIVFMSIQKVREGCACTYPIQYNRLHNNIILILSNLDVLSIFAFILFKFYEYNALGCLPPVKCKNDCLTANCIVH